MNKKDLQILCHLRNDARMPLTKMSKKTRIPVSTIFDRLKVSEKELITKHTSLIDFSQLGYHARVNIALKVDREHKISVKDYLLGHESTNSVYKINNGFDFMVEGVFKHINHMEQFIDDLESKFNIEEKKFFFIIEDLKREAFMSNPNLLPQ
ncbi:Lrp/AsnC family transcriptional regulator [Candidatus Woesearchaeota archaeon]|jgi:Lrp/AsnC family transcriptional regulator, leucine-responsive regulatory protein|nr:Lrp/AsnC family transcriptional regulator [Candidatus Woesearchaeota archaeon]